MSAGRIALGVSLILLATLPLWLTGVYYVNVSSQILIYAIFALALNVLVGHAGLVSLGHAGLFGLASYACAIALHANWSHTASIAVAMVITLFGTAVFAFLSLRAIGIGFIMITLAIGQILWGLAYRWIDLTNGDNGVSVAARPAPFGLSLASPAVFYYATLLVFLLSVLIAAIFARSPFGASLRGTRDQPRRMNALGFHVWMIRFYACLFSGVMTSWSP